MEINIPYDPLPKQQKFHHSDKPFRLYSGAVGAGKTLSLCAEALRLAIEYPGSIGLLGRYNYSDLKRTTLFTFMELIDDMPEGIYNYNKSDGVFKLLLPERETSIIYFMRLDILTPIKSLNLDYFGVDETTEVPKEVWDLLVTRLRHGKINRLIGFGATNPDSKSHWLYKYFYDSNDSDYDLIETYSFENTYLPEHYLKQLDKMKVDKDFYDRYVMGKWGSFKGLVYKSFNRGIHVIENRNPHPDSRVYRTIDFGYNNPFVCLFVERTKDDEWIIFDEHYQKEMLLSEHVIEINRRNYPIENTWCDPSAKQERMELQSLGIECSPGNNDVKAGILAVKELLAIDKNNRCKLKVCKRCINVIKEFESYKYKTKDDVISDEVVKEMDHAQDCLRYLILSETGGFNPQFSEEDVLITSQGSVFR
jgi:phage terminase large subunit